MLHEIFWNGEHKEEGWEEGQTFEAATLTREDGSYRLRGEVIHETRYLLEITEGRFSGYPVVELTREDLKALRDAIIRELDK